MLIRKFNECQEFVAGDNSILRELLHPNAQNLKINYSLAHAKVLPSQSTQLHILDFSEVYYILKGQGIMHIGKEFADVFAGDAIYIPPGAKQFIENTGEEPLEFLCIVEPAWVPDCEMIDKRGSNE